MANIVELYGLKPGDRIVLPIFQTGLSKHHAIYRGKDGSGEDWFIENRIFVGVHWIKSSDLFKNGIAVDRIIRFEGGQYQREQAIQRAEDLIGKKYNLLTYNCEHFANEVQYGVPTSEQVGNVFLLSVGLIVLCLATSKD